MIKGYCKKHYNNECIAIAMVYHVSNRFLKKNLKFTSEVWVFSLLWVLAPSWQHFGRWFLCQLNLVELYYRLIDLNQDSKVIQGGEIMKTLKILTVFVNFRLSQIQNYSVQIKKMKDKLFRKLKKKLLLPNVYKRC